MFVIVVQNICEYLDCFCFEKISNFYICHFYRTIIGFLKVYQFIESTGDEMVFQITSWKLIILDLYLFLLEIWCSIAFTVLKVYLDRSLENSHFFILFNLFWQALYLYTRFNFFHEKTLLFFIFFFLFWLNLWWFLLHHLLWHCYLRERIISCWLNLSRRYFA